MSKEEPQDEGVVDVTAFKEMGALLLEVTGAAGLLFEHQGVEIRVSLIEAAGREVRGFEGRRKDEQRDPTG